MKRLLLLYAEMDALIRTPNPIAAKSFTSRLRFQSAVTDPGTLADIAQAVARQDVQVKHPFADRLGISHQLSWHCSAAQYPTAGHQTGKAHRYSG